MTPRLDVPSPIRSLMVAAQCRYRTAMRKHADRRNQEKN
jgi:hypothetical protein